MPRIVDHDAYREELLQQAFALFARQSYGAVSMRQIAEALGVSTGTLYHYFPSKRALFEQAVAKVVDRDLAAWEKTVNPQASLDDKLREWFDMIVQQRAELTSAIMLTIDYYRQGQSSTDGTGVLVLLESYVDTVAALLDLPRTVCIVMLTAVDGLLLWHYPLVDTSALASSLDQLRIMIVSYARAADRSTDE